MRAVNLLPDQYRRRVPTGTAGGAYVVVGALLFILVAAAIYILASNQVNDRKDELVKVKNETAVAQAEASSLAAFGSFSTIKNTRVNSVRGLAGQRFDFERLMRELAHVLPRGSWISTFDASASPAAAAAAGGTSTGSGPSLRLTGCAPTPSVVATVLVRLRKLHRSQDVRLASSTRAGTQAASGSEGCGSTRNRPNYSFELNVDFTPTATRSDLVATDKVPASLGGGQ